MPHSDLLDKTRLKNNVFFFDLDGTLVDSLLDLMSAANRVISQYAPQKPRLEKDFFRTAIGYSSKIFISKIFNIQDPDEVSFYEKIYHDDYAKNCSIETKPYAGIPELLRQLKEKNITMAVISNKEVKLVENILSAVKLSSFFTAVLGGDSAQAPKPSPELLKVATQRLKLQENGNRIIHIGDGIQDLQAAKNFGCLSCWVSWGYNQDYSLGPDFIVHKPQEILGLV